MRDDKVLARLSSTAIAMSKHFLPHPQSGAGAPEEPGLMAKLGARTVVAATLRAVQLLGRQFVLGQTMKEAQHEAASARKHAPPLRFSYDMLGEGARTDEDALRYLKAYADAIESHSCKVRFHGATEQNDGISIKLSALHPRYEDAQSQRVMDELVPRVWACASKPPRPTSTSRSTPRKWTAWSCRWKSLRRCWRWWPNTARSGRALAWPCSPTRRVRWS